MPRLKEGATPPSGASLQDLERHKASIMREIEKSRGEDKKEVDKLRSDLDEANEWIKARKKADDSREDQDGGTTIVVPPNTMAPQHGGETTPTNENNGPDASEKPKRGWRRLY